MKLENYPIDKLKQEIEAIIGRQIDLKNCRVFFFGSRVSGQGDEQSDIDIGIDRGAPIGLDIMAKIKEEIDKLPVLYKIEVVDFYSVSDDFRRVALQYTEEIL